MSCTFHLSLNLAKALQKLRTIRINGGQTMFYGNIGTLFQNMFSKYFRQYEQKIYFY